ncbi:MAG: AIM24 family protein [Verrucomicrobiaceae bacterium]|nr:MAG: AIM24 family protein [Verrucomicrobiaceae bacterium]
MTLAGCMVAYEGNIKFEKALTGGEGLFGALKRKATGESLNLMITSGKGVVYAANKAKELTILPLNGEKLFCESRSLLAYDQSLRTNTAFVGLRGAASGQGLFTTTLEGNGNVVIMSDGTAIMLEVSPAEPLFCDPDAFLGYKGNITQEFVFDVNWRTMIGETSGESYKLKFSGTGVVYIQPSENK